MHAPDDGTTPLGSVMRRLITPWEYRHLYAVAGVRFAAGGFHLGIGVVLLSLGRRAETDRERRKCYGWAAWFLMFAALLFSGGYLDMTAAAGLRRADQTGRPRAPHGLRLLDFD